MIVFPFSIDIPAPTHGKPVAAVFRPATDIFSLDDLVSRQPLKINLKRGKKR